MSTNKLTYVTEYLLNDEGILIDIGGAQQQF